jgi:hypothetical protein
LLLLACGAGAELLLDGGGALLAFVGGLLPPPLVLPLSPLPLPPIS